MKTMTSFKPEDQNPKCCPTADLVSWEQGPFESPYEGMLDRWGHPRYTGDKVIVHAHHRARCSRCGKRNYFLDRQVHARLGYRKPPDGSPYALHVSVLTCWRTEIESVMRGVGDSMDNLVAAAPPADWGADPDWLDWDFNDGFGAENGVPFLVWTDDWVYFPVCYDGSEWVGAVPRNPRNEPTEHFGGG